MAFDETTPPHRPRAWLAAGGVVAAVLAVGGFFVVTDEDSDKAGELRSSSDHRFTLTYPDDWKPRSEEELETLPGKPLALLRRKDGKGFVVVRKEKAAPRDFGKFSQDLTRELRDRVKDFQKRSSRTIRVKSGRAFFYSYIRRKQGTVHTVVLVPAGNRSYAINTVSTGGEERVAREIARIILSFAT